MIKPNFIKAQVAKSRANKQVSPFLRRMIASTVDTVARDHYGAAYSTKCLQASCAVHDLLATLGITSQIVVGAMCAAEVFEDPRFGTWGGFWGDDHHVWVTTEFYELVDLSVAEMTKHPRSSRKGGISMPPLWWNDIVTWPSVIKYLPDSVVQKPRFPDPADNADLDLFLSRVEALWDHTLLQGRVEDVVFTPLLESPSSMNRFHEAGHPWFERAIVFQDQDIPFPAWMLEREQELIIAHREGRRAPTRLAATLGTLPS